MIALSILCVLWAREWQDTYDPRVLLSYPRAAYMDLHREKFDALVEPHAPSVVRCADAIRVLEPDPARQGYLLYFVEPGIHYRLDYELWGVNFHPPTPTEMEALRRANGWPALRGDCKAKAIFLASVAANLGIKYRFAHAPKHMWVEIEIDRGWFAIFRNGRTSSARDLEASDWGKVRTEAERLALIARLDSKAPADAKYTDAWNVIIVPPGDPDWNNPKRSPENRDGWFEQLRAWGFAGVVFTVCMTAAHRRECRQRKQCSEKL